jgi:hypothetical protein
MSAPLLEGDSVGIKDKKHRMGCLTFVSLPNFNRRTHGRDLWKAFQFARFSSLILDFKPDRSIGIPIAFGDIVDWLMT